MPNFSSKQYEWADVQVVMLGRVVTGIQSIEYSVKKDKQYVRGRGNEPLAIQHGAKSYEGKIGLLQSEVEALEAAARALNPDYDITDIDFDIAVSYGLGSTLQRDIVTSLSITEDPRSISNDDTFMEIELPFMALGIRRGV